MASEEASKLNAYAVLANVAVEASKVNAYGVLQNASVEVSKLNAYAVPRLAASWRSPSSTPMRCSARRRRRPSCWR